MGNLANQIEELENEINDLREENAELESRIDDRESDYWTACDRADRAEALALALLENLNGDLVEVWRDHAAVLKELGYST